MKKIAIIILLTAAVLPLSAGDLQISQVDMTNLLFRGEIDIYFTANEQPLPGDLSVTENSAGPLEITGFDTEPNRNSGINFILLIDNSGSMYDESYQGSSRIKQARLALGAFIDQIENTGDRAAIYSFNTKLRELAPFGTDAAGLRKSLSELQRPDTEMAYTELYNSLTEVTSLFPKTAGRRAVIVLSDGENFPAGREAGSGSDEWGSFRATPSDVTDAFQRAGISLDGINIADNRDRSLEDICNGSGGMFHDVRSTGEISRVYTDIREKILNEYRVTVAAPPFTANPTELELHFKSYTDSRRVLVPVIFGSSRALPLPVIIIALAAGIGGIAGLYLKRFEKPVAHAQIKSLESYRGTILNEDVTVIGSGRDADLTLAGSPGIDARHATIVRDEKTGAFTLVSEKTVRVNNRKVKTRTLAPGDVIRIEGRTIIFDAPGSETSG